MNLGKERMRETGPEDLSVSVKVPHSMSRACCHLEKEERRAARSMSTPERIWFQKTGDTSGGSYIRACSEEDRWVAVARVKECRFGGPIREGVLEGGYRFEERSGKMPTLNWVVAQLQGNLGAAHGEGKDTGSNAVWADGTGWGRSSDMVAGEKEAVQHPESASMVEPVPWRWGRG